MGSLTNDIPLKFGFTSQCKENKVLVLDKKIKYLEGRPGRP